MSDPKAASEDGTASSTASSTASGTGSEDIGYADALNELETILSELEDESMDIDVLSDRVERAAVLIRVCRGRINVAQERVSAVVAELDDLTAPPNGSNAE